MVKGNERSMEQLLELGEEMGYGEVRFGKIQEDCVRYLERHVSSAEKCISYVYTQVSMHLCMYTGCVCFPNSASFSK